MLRGMASAATVERGPEDVVIGVVGDGFSALHTYATAVYLGFAPEQVGIFGEGTNPVHAYQQYAWNLGQTILRSESESHFLPADWPTFSQIDAVSRLDPTPLMRSAMRRFNPGVPEILALADVVSTTLGYPARVLGGRRVGWVVREPGPPRHFALYDEDGILLGRARHLMIAVGHGPLAFPGVYGEARRRRELAGRIVQSYEAKRFVAGGRYLVVGSGIASLNEWVNAVEAGASCIALRRNPHPDDQDLNVPRCLFDGSGIDAFEGLSFDERLEFLGEVLRGTSPHRREWIKELKAAGAEGRFEEVIGDLDVIEPGPAGLRAHVRMHDGGDGGWLDLTGIVCGTGFVKSVYALPVLARLVRAYGVPVEHDRIRLTTNCGVPPLDEPDSRLCLNGLSANSVVPNADTISGTKYIARRFVGDVARAERLRRRSIPGRFWLQLRLAGRTSRALRRIPKTRQLA
jgi:hypothetical protein